MKYLVLFLLPLLVLGSCMEDTSAYLPQEKEEVTVDRPTSGGDEEPEPSHEDLTPGLNNIYIDVTMPDQSVVKRRFKYFMPISLSSAKPISLLFDFHGNASLGKDPLEYVGNNHSLNLLANRENIIVVFPAGSSDVGSIGWQQTELELPFVDAMIQYFKSKKPLYNINRVYSTGHSSGAIFSFVLALERSDVFAAVAPRSGQIKLNTQNPKRAVPIRAFNGVADKTVQHTSAVDNMSKLAVTVGGYLPNDMVYQEKDTLEIPGYCKYQIRTWSGAKADYQIYSLIDIEHNLELYQVQPLIWDFLSAHRLDFVNESLYLSVGSTSITAEQGAKIQIDIKSNDDAIITFDAPSDWSPTLEKGMLKLSAPEDFFNCKNRRGEIKITATKGEQNVTRTITYSLNPPKVFFEVGDVYFNAKMEPVGVVYWVNPDNIKEAKVVSAKTVSLKFGVCDPSNRFLTESLEDGLGNTKIWVDRNIALGTDGVITAENSCYVWANEYDNKSGWYLPAGNEFLLIAKDMAMVNATLSKIGGNLLTGEGYEKYASSTVVSDRKSRAIVCYSFSLGLSNLALKGNDSSYILTIAIKNVTK